MDVLLTFTGFHDPYFKGLVDEEEQPGPILSLLSARTFNQIYLFDTPGTQKITLETKESISRLYQNSHASILQLKIDDPTDYAQILNSLRTYIPSILEQNRAARFWIAVASGTPQMHACWILLVANHEIPAQILHVRPPRFVTKEKPIVSEIKFRSAESEEAHIFFRKSLEPYQKNKHDTDIAQVASQIGIVGDHPKMQSLFETAEMLAPSRAPILIMGETGTGKELFAKLIHHLSRRPKEKFIAVNCAAIPENLVESILFGHKKGAFTGALSDQMGKFEFADNGTLFLDELGDLPLVVQAKLLRVLQDGLVEAVGARKAQKVDVRVIGATNRDLRKLVRDGKFREDLFYRLNVGELQLPPLRERRTDIPILALHILARINESLRRPKRLAPDALIRLQSHNWPGNVRDLENSLERSARLSRNEVLTANDLLINEPVSYADPLDALPEPYEGFSLDDFLTSARKQLILKALEASNGNQSAAARLLGVTPQAVHKFLQLTKAETEI